MITSSARRLPLIGAEVDLDRRLVERPGGSVRLSPTEARLLEHLAAHPDEVISHDRLLQAVWSYRPGVRSRTVVTTIERLRRKIEVEPSHPLHVITAEGGYLFSPVPPSGPDTLASREALLVRVSSAVERREPLVTLVGPGGIGKSWLAQEVAALSASRRTAVTPVDLEGVRRADEAMRRIASALGIGDPGPERLARALGARAPLLLLLDDLDALVPDAAGLAPIVGVPGVSVLATSRAPLGLEGEQIVAVELLSLTDTRLLLLRLARQAGARDEVLTDSFIEPICASTEGIPLAVVLVAPWLALLPPDEVATRVLALPALEPSALPERHRGLDACVARSWESLDPEDVRSIRLVCAVPGPMPLDGLEALLEDRPLERLARLRQRSWILVEADGRVRVLASIRAFVAARTPPPLARAARARLLDWARPAVRGHLDRLGGADHAPAMARLERDLPMLWGLFDSAPRGPERARFAGDLASVELLIGIGPRTPARLDEAISEAGDEPDLARLLLLRAHLAQRAGRSALVDLRMALDLAARTGDRALSVEARIRLGVEERRGGAVEEAAAELDRALGEADASSPLWGRAAIERAAVEIARKSWATAVARLRPVEALARRIGDRRLEMLASGSIASCERHLDRWLDAEVAMRRALDAAEALHDLENVAHLRSNLANLYTFDGRADEAVRLLKDALAFYRRHGMLRSEGFALQGLAFAQLALGRPSRAARLVAEARDTFRAAAFPLGEASTLGLLARLDHHAGHPADALRRYEEAMALLTASGMANALGAFQALAAIAAADLSDSARAASLRAAADRSLEGSGTRRVLEVVDAALAAMGRPDGADARIEVRARLGSIEIDRILS